MGQLRFIIAAQAGSLLLFILMMGSVYAEDSPDAVVSEQELIRLWDEAELDTLLLVFPPFAVGNPDHPVTLFLDAALEKDGHRAARGYHTVIETRSHPEVVPRAMSRLIQYYYATGDVPTATQWERRLEMEYPDFQKAAPPTISSRVVNYPYTLQLGAYQVLKNAQQMCEKAQECGLSSQILQKYVNGRMLYLVWAGQFTTEADAEKTGQRLQREKKFSYRVIARNQESNGE